MDLVPHHAGSGQTGCICSSAFFTDTALWLPGSKGIQLLQGSVMLGLINLQQAAHRPMQKYHLQSIPFAVEYCSVISHNHRNPLRPFSPLLEITKVDYH